MLSRSVLNSCRRKAAVQRAGTRSLATVTEAPASSSSAVPPRIISRPDGEQAAIHTAVLLNRSPIITRTPTKFERAYYAYQARIERALHNPYPYEFHFKPNSPLEVQFDKEEMQREKKAFGHAATPSPRVKTEAETTESSGLSALPLMEVQEQEVEKTVPREHESDRTGDVKSLDRKGQRNVYLLVLAKDTTGKQSWKFPQVPVNSQENLFESATNNLRSPFGAKMDTWVVSKNPIGVYKPAPSKPTDKLQDYLFFYKAHILAGQVNPDGKNVLDFAWLTKEEIQTRVDKGYWDGVKDMISDY